MSSHPLRAAVEKFLSDAGSRLATRGTESPEALLASPLRDLVVTASSALLSRSLDLGDQATESGIGRPDFALKDSRLVLGHVELKQLGKGARPGRYRDAHDKDQWKRFQLLPNLLYTDGSEFLLFRDGIEVSPEGNRTALVTIPLEASTSPKPVTDAALDELQRLLIDFFAWSPAPPRSLSDLAVKIAPLCGVLRDTVRDALATPGSQVASFTRDLRTTILPDADDDDLADAFAQTCTYSMLLAASDGARHLEASAVEATLRAAHPLLADIVRHLLHPKAEAEIAWATALLRRQLEVVDFATLGGTRGRDTWLYFYEDFLAKYDIRLRNNRGVYYTPAEVISAQVALADDVLRNRLGKADGFGDHGVFVVDPAVGTGSYPIAIVNAAAGAAAAYGAGMTGPAVSSVIERIHAFEILVGPYAVAKMRLSELVRDMGGSLPTAGLNVYLVDALAPPDTDTTLLGPLGAILTEEQERARDFKTKQPIVVCIGNPPYDREQRDVDDQDSKRKGSWVRYGYPEHPGDRALLDDYTDPVRAAGQGRHLKNLYNDYVYFWRWASWKAFEFHPTHTKANGGIISYITAASWLGGPAFTGMRAHLRSQCDDIYVLDLGGEGRGARTSENVFDIQTPVAITMCVRDTGAKRNRLARVHYADWSAGTRAEKLERLVAVESLADIEWTTLDLPSPGSPIIPDGDGDWPAWPTIERLMPWAYSGAQLKRTWPIAPSSEVLADRWSELVHAPTSQRRDLFVATRDRDLTWDGRTSSAVIPKGRPLNELDSDDPAKRAAAAKLPTATTYSFRTLDDQFVLLDARLGDYLKPILWDLHGPTQAYLSTIVAHPIKGGVAATIVGSSPPDMDIYCNRGHAGNFPLWRDADGTTPNVTPGLLAALTTAYGSSVDGPALFCYLAGILGTPAYADRYDEQLARPNPRIPLALSSEDFFDVSKRGRRIAYLHSRGTRFSAAGESLPTGTAQLQTAVDTARTPEACAYDASTGELRIGDGIVIGVTEPVWEFEASGFKPVQEWIRRRLAPIPGRARSELDAIRTITWDMAMQQDLLRTIWIVEELVETHTPAMADALERIERNGTWRAEDLPEPDEASKEAPSVTR